MSFEYTWRWFGPNDTVTLDEIKQVGVTGIVTALHQIPVGEIWPVEDILERKKILKKKGLKWSVVESLPVHEDIKKGNKTRDSLIENYKQSIKNLSQCGIHTICYNFMPVLDWSRTNLKIAQENGTITTGFDPKQFAAFDLFILKRPGAEKDYSEKIIKDARKYYDNISRDEIEELTGTILYGLPGSLEKLSIDDFRSAVLEYNRIGEEKVRENLCHFIREITPTAEQYGVFLAIHPDDPPWTLLGLPRVAGTKKDLEKILQAYDSPSNGITFCTGSLGARYNNDIPDMVKAFAPRINFIHLRSLVRDVDGNFTESGHLEGDIDIYTVIKELLIEQNHRRVKSNKDIKIPVRPDHGQLMLFEKEKEGIYPGYSLLGRMKGLAEIKGLELGISKSLNLQYNFFPVIYLNKALNS